MTPSINVKIRTATFARITAFTGESSRRALSGIADCLVKAVTERIVGLVGISLNLYRPEVEAAICVSDLSAFGAVMECQRRKWQVPKRIAIAGFGDFEISSCSHPTITTVGVNCYEIGKRSGELLLRAIEGERASKPIGAETIITPYAVIPRDSA